MMRIIATVALLCGCLGGMARAEQDEAEVVAQSNGSSWDGNVGPVRVSVKWALIDLLRGKRQSRITLDEAAKRMDWAKLVIKESGHLDVSRYFYVKISDPSGNTAKLGYRCFGYSKIPYMDVQGIDLEIRLSDGSRTDKVLISDNAKNNPALFAVVQAARDSLRAILGPRGEWYVERRDRARAQAILDTLDWLQGEGIPPVARHVSEDVRD